MKKSAGSGLTWDGGGCLVWRNVLDTLRVITGKSYILSTTERLGPSIVLQNVMSNSFIALRERFHNHTILSKLNNEFEMVGVPRSANL